MRRCEAMWPLVLLPKLLSGSLNKQIIQDLFGEFTLYGIHMLYLIMSMFGEVMIAYMNVLQNSQQGIQYLVNVSCACRKVREYGVCVNHASGQKKRAGTSKDKLCRSYCDHKE